MHKNGHLFGLYFGNGDKQREWEVIKIENRKNNIHHVPIRVVITEITLGQKVNNKMCFQVITLRLFVNAYKNLVLESGGVASHNGKRQIPARPLTVLLLSPQNTCHYIAPTAHLIRINRIY